MFTAITLCALGLGYAIGVMQGGIHIYTGKEVPKVVEKEEPKYNTIVPPHPEVQQYFDQTKGQIL